jgi:hypothetical protein
VSSEHPNGWKEFLVGVVANFPAFPPTAGGHCDRASRAPYKLPGRLHLLHALSLASFPLRSILSLNASYGLTAFQCCHCLCGSCPYLRLVLARLLFLP